MCPSACILMRTQKRGAGKVTPRLSHFLRIPAAEAASLILPHSFCLTHTGCLACLPHLLHIPTAEAATFPQPHSFCLIRAGCPTHSAMLITYPSGRGCPERMPFDPNLCRVIETDGSSVLIHTSYRIQCSADICLVPDDTLKHAGRKANPAHVRSSPAPPSRTACYLTWPRYTSAYLGSCHSVGSSSPPLVCLELTGSPCCWDASSFVSGELDRLAVP